MKSTLIDGDDSTWHMYIEKYSDHDYSKKFMAMILNPIDKSWSKVSESCRAYLQQ